MLYAACSRPPGSVARLHANTSRHLGASHDLIEEQLFGVARPVGRIGNHEGIAGCNPRRNACRNTLN
jgi:hypothetical protein